MTDTTVVTDLTGTMSAEPDAEKIATVVLSGETLRDWLTPVVPFVASAGDMGALRCIELHVDGQWLLASATDRYRAVVHRLRIVGPVQQPAAAPLNPREAQVSQPFTTGLYATDVQHLLAAAAGCAVTYEATDPEFGEEIESAVYEHGLSHCNGNVRVVLDIWPDHIVARWVAEHRAGSCTYQRSPLVADWQEKGHPARRLVLNAVGNRAHAVPAGILLAGTFVRDLGQVAHDIGFRQPIRWWCTANEDATRSAVGWSIGGDLVGLLMPVIQRTDPEFAAPNPLADKAWKALAETAGGAA